MIPRRALVLTAGLGTRLRPLTFLRAKPALPVAGEPLARRIIRWLAAGGIRDLVLNLHHLPDTVTAVLGDGSDLGVRVRYSWEQPVVLGSAGGPRHALDLLADATFFIVNGDTLTDVDLRAVAERHQASGARVTLALVPNVAPLQYGGVLVSGGYVTGFVRKGPAAAGSYHFIGVQVADASVFEPLRDGEPANSIGGVYDRLLDGEPGAIAAHVSDARFLDIGTPSGYLDTSLAFARAGHGGGSSGAHVQIDPSASVTDSVLWDDVVVGRDSVLSRCVVTSGVRVPAGSRYDSAIIMAADSGHLQVTALTA